MDNFSNLLNPKLCTKVEEIPFTIPDDSEKKKKKKHYKIRKHFEIGGDSEVQLFSKNTPYQELQQSFEAYQNSIEPQSNPNNEKILLSKAFKYLRPQTNFFFYCPLSDQPVSSTFIKKSNQPNQITIPIHLP